MYTIGIDLGTSAVKLLLMGDGGEIVRIASREYPIEFPRPGWSQQDPEDWWKAVRAGIPELLEGVDAGQVRGIGAGGQMHGLVALDENDAVIRPAILWNDGRTQKQVEYLNEAIGREKLSRYTANIAFAGFTAPKLLWMRENEPELFRRIHKIMLPKDYINYRLTGVHCTDYSDASGMLLLDVERKCWSREMLDICGVTEAQLPRLYESWETVGTLLPEAAARLGLRADVAVCAGAGDNAAAAVGCGAVGGGCCNISLGTSGTVFITSDSFGVDRQNALHSFAHADGGYHLMGCILSAASCNKWWQEDVLGGGDYQGEEAKIAPERLGRVAFAIRDCVEIARGQGIDIRASRVCGGGAKSALWRTILSNVLGIPLELPQTEQGPGYGGAMLAAVACGAYPDVKTCVRKLTAVKDVTQPEPGLAAAYEKRYRVWRKLYPAMKPFYQALAEEE